MNPQEAVDMIRSDPRPLTQVKLSFDVTKMQADGLTNDPNEYTDEKFYQIFQDHMDKSNADTNTFSVKTTFRGEETGETIRLIIKRKKGKFVYKYKNVLGYLNPIFKGKMLFQAMWKYFWDKRFAEEVERNIRQLVWKTMPDWSKMAPTDAIEDVEVNGQK